MRVVVQRVKHARVTVAGEVVGQVGPGLLVLLGAGQGDGAADVDYLVEKVVNLRIFEGVPAPAAPTVTTADTGGSIPDSRGQSPPAKMNRSLLDTGGGLLVVSQFTLYGDCRRGRRPSFTEALEPTAAAALCERFVQQARALGAAVATGRFGAMMDVELCNDGPVTLLLDSRKAF